ncbi:MAG: hypothetical protein RIE73_27960 [Coleofasciculus sp. C1-SOL-03]|jgi:hypothetical protein|uniref:hypothetical protein n=1 Tax=Coleofasciculus sp. C1-SOL-03 TaxID=3069522 RepID=UPI0032FC4313
MSENNKSSLIVIDTNIFEHLLYEPKNIVLGDWQAKTEEKHINRLLKFLQKQDYRLCLDQGKRIKNEYKHRLNSRISQSDDEGDEIQILRYWLLFNDHHYVDSKINLPLDKALKTIILNDDNQPETTDCIFVHTAALSLCDLVTNDSDYTLSDDQKKRGDRKRSRSDKNKRKRRQKHSKLKSDAPNLPSRIERIKEAIRINLDHEATDILTSLQAHEIYLYRS